MAKYAAVMSVTIRVTVPQLVRRVSHFRQLVGWVECLISKVIVQPHTYTRTRTHIYIWAPNMGTRIFFVLKVIFKQIKAILMIVLEYVR